VPGIAIRTTMIAGHPGETEDDFLEMMTFIEKSRFERLIKQQRADAVMELQQNISLEINQERIGKTLKVIVDRKEGGNFIGRTEYDSPEVDNEVLIEAKDTYLRIGDFVNVTITDATEFDLTAQVAATELAR
jgi:ribosomal protein S12 methylthiotransferase